MARYRTKPVEIDAIQWTGGNKQEMKQFLGGTMYILSNGETLLIDTLEGTMTAWPGDYIIRGLKGEYYPCKPDIFLMKYEPCR